jgi:hypothetical protein
MRTGDPKAVWSDRRGRRGERRLREKRAPDRCLQSFFIAPDEPTVYRRPQLLNRGQCRIYRQKQFEVTPRGTMANMWSDPPHSTRFVVLAPPRNLHNNLLDFRNGNSTCPPPPNGEMFRVGCSSSLPYH